jgi:hypothetical protein
MDAKRKRAQADKVRRVVATHLKDQGFMRTKTSFWTRPRGPVIEFIHLHLFSYAPAFRIHAGIRVLESAFDAVHLNGPSSSPDNLLPPFDDTVEQVGNCAAAIAGWCETFALPWLAQWQDLRALATSEDSPLTVADRSALAGSLEHTARSPHARQSKRLLGVG